LLEFGRERAEVDTSKIVLTHHRLTSQGLRTLGLAGEAEPLKPMTEAGSGGVQDKDKALLAEILSRVNDLFQGDLTDDDRLIYVNGVIRGKLLENETLVQQSEHNSKEQFAASPSLRKAMVDAIIDAFDAHAAMSKQALDSSEVREGLIDVLLGPGQLYEALRQKGGFESRVGR
jgi:type I restriction enzyme, R subunit